MPATYAHLRFGREVLEKLPDHIKQIIMSEPELFTIGLQGPDPFYLVISPFFGVRQRIRKNGFDNHAASGLHFMVPASRVAERSGFSAPEMSYIYGMICHFALDREAHAYIIEEAKKPEHVHAQIEMEFDRRLLVHDGKDPLSTRLTDGFIPSPRNTAVILQFYPDTNYPDLHAALVSTVIVNEIFLCPGKLKRNIVRLLIKIFRLNENTWHHVMSEHPAPQCAETNRVIAGFYKSAIDKAVLLCTDFEKCAKGEKDWDELYMYNFKGIKTE
jgi:hypothetical protein